MDNSDGLTGQTAADATRRVKDAASTVVERGKEAANEAVSKGAERASNVVDKTASALRRAADDVESDNRMIGVALRKSAESIERAAQSFQGGDLSRAVEDLNGFARRQPALFLGASVALGFALARVGKTAIEQSADGAAAGGGETPLAGV